MKKPHVLNRAMFNRGGTSAYGRGITSNLVSDEQRIKYNSGGRVGLVNGGNWWDEIDISDTRYGVRPIDRFSSIPSARGSNQNWESGNWNWPWAKPKYPEITVDKEDPRPGGGDPEIQAPASFGVEKTLSNLYEDPVALPTDTKSDELGAGDEWETFAEKLYDKKGAKGKAQLELAGNVLAAAFQPKKEAMAILGKGLGDFGKTASARKEKMEDIAATGKMYDKIYKTRAIEKGEQDRLTAKEARLAAKNAKTDIGQAFFDKMEKTGWNDKNLANNLREASGGKFDFKEVDEVTFKGMLQDPESSHESRIVYKGDIMVVDKNKPVDQWSVKAQIFAGI